MKKEILTAIVSGFVNYGEKDRIVRLISPEHGKISVMVKNARSTKGALVGIFDIGNQVQVGILPPKQGEIWRLLDADLVQGYGQIHKDVLKLGILFYCCEIVDHLSLQNEPIPRLYGLLESSLNLLEKIDTPANAFHLAFASKALSFAGIQPNLQSCIHCAKPISNPSLYQPTMGGAIHRDCNKNLSKEIGQKSLPSSLSWLEQINHLLYTPLAETHTLSIHNGENWSLARSIEEQTERSLQSKTFLQSLYP